MEGEHFVVDLAGGKPPHTDSVETNLTESGAFTLRPADPVQSMVSLDAYACPSGAIHRARSEPEISEHQ